MESRRERLRKAAARRRARDFSPGPVLPPPAIGGEEQPEILLRCRRGRHSGAGGFCLRGPDGQGAQRPAWVGRGWTAHPGPKRGCSSLPVHGKRERVAGPSRKPDPPLPKREKAGKNRRPRRVPEKAPAEKTASPSRESSPPPAEEGKAGPAKAKYTLQVGAFNNPQEAQELVNQLKKKGYEAYQVTGSAAAKGTLHRVRIGHFQNLQEARQFALTFEKKENLKPIISSLQNP